MIKVFLFNLILILHLYASDDLVAQKQNTLYVQNLIEREEKIAKNFEKYILTEFKLPSMSDLIDDKYLGSNFSVENRMGENIGFLNASELKLKYLISKDEYNNLDDYIVQLYNRDLYRDFTNVNFTEKYTNNVKRVDLTNSYVKMKLQSDEANTIFDILKNNNTIQKDCSSPVAGTYCNNSAKTIRWYKDTTAYIEYNKKNFDKGNIILDKYNLTEIQLADLPKGTYPQLANLPVGAYIFISGVKYVKFTDDDKGTLNDPSDDTLRIFKVN